MPDLLPDDMGTTAMWAFVVSFFSPLVLNFLIARSWRPWVKSLAAFGFAVIVGVTTALLTGSYAGLGIPAAILLSLVVSITAYQNFWRNIAPTMQAHVGVGAEHDTAR